MPTQTKHAASTVNANLDSIDNLAAHVQKHGERQYKSHLVELEAITGDLHAAQFLSCVLHWASSRGFSAFYKFHQPCEHHLYERGDSWTEEMGWSYYHLTKARDKVATRNTSGSSRNAILDSKSMSSLVIYWTDKDQKTSWYLNIDLLNECLRRYYEGEPMPWEEREPVSAEAASSPAKAQGQRTLDDEASAAQSEREAAREAVNNRLGAVENPVRNSHFGVLFQSSTQFENLNRIDDWEISIVYNKESSLQQSLQHDDVDDTPDCEQSPGNNGNSTSKGQAASVLIEVLRPQARKANLCTKDPAVPLSEKQVRKLQGRLKQTLEALTEHAARGSYQSALAYIVAQLIQKENVRQPVQQLARKYPLRWILTAALVARDRADYPIAYMRKVFPDWAARSGYQREYEQEQQAEQRAANRTHRTYRETWESLDPHEKNRVREAVMRQLPRDLEKRITSWGGQPTLESYLAGGWPYTAKRQFKAMIVNWLGTGKIERPDPEDVLPSDSELR